MEIIEVKNLYKNYKKIEAVKGISFSVKQGEIFGLLGPNGAGKTTTIKKKAKIDKMGELQPVPVPYSPQVGTPVGSLGKPPVSTPVITPHVRAMKELQRDIVEHARAKDIAKAIPIGDIPIAKAVCKRPEDGLVRNLKIPSR